MIRVHAEAVKNTKNVMAAFMHKLLPKFVQCPNLLSKKLAPGEVSAVVLKMVMEQEKKSASFTSQYGQVRQPVSAEYQGYRLVAAGSQLFLSTSSTSTILH